MSAHIGGEAPMPTSTLEFQIPDGNHVLPVMVSPVVEALVKRVVEAMIIVFLSQSGVVVL